MIDEPLSGKQRAAQARCDAMVHHARAQIRAQGVDKFSVNEVLRLSGGSKATLVKYFGDRTGLIAAAIGAEARETMAALSQKCAADTPFEQSLETALSGILHFYLSPGAIAIYRAVISAADPKSAAAFYEEGHRVVVEGLAALLDAYKRSDVTAGLDCHDVADQMLHAIRAGIYEQTLIGLLNRTGDEELIAKRIQSSMALFLPALRGR